MRTKILIIIILLFAAFLRLTNLKSAPVSLFSDEVDAGYQATLLNKCQSDYFGNKYPFHLHSFADYRTPFYIYSIAFIQNFTQDKELAVRIPAAIFGILVCLAIYLLSLKITKSTTISLVSLFLASISPWLISYSRVGFEVTGMLFCLILGIYFLLKDKYYLSILLMAFSAYFYSTAKLFIVLLAISMIIINFNKYKKIKLKQIILILLFTLIIGLPYIKDTVQGKSGFRFSYINIFSDPTNSTEIDYKRFEDALITNPNQIGVKTSLESKIFHNKITQISNKFISNYLSSFSTEFLFLKGDSNLRHGTGLGYLFPFELFLLIMGIFALRKNKHFSFLLSYLLLSPVSYALTRDSASAHGTRLIIMAPILIIFISAGIVEISKRYKKAIFILIILYAFFFGNYIHNYYRHYPLQSAKQWHFGIKEALGESKKLENNYQKIIYSNRYESFLPFFLFYRNYLPNTCNPSLHIKDNVLDDKYFFGPIDYDNIDNSLIVMPLSEYKVNTDKLTQFTIVFTSTKKYTEQEQFLILKPL
jgi:4-amino-4-deoxy-L-arabinose transferase-like glycosyltransferase